ncbi:MAG: hypothetical protein IKD85_05800 [Firmicutes bacterium]|nr:hypothetical protein [Bacillota bacterium]
MTLDRALSLLEEKGIRCSVEEIRPPRDRRSEEEKGELRVLRTQDEGGICKLIVCRV